MKYIIKNKKTIIVNIVVTFILIASLFWIINNSNHMKQMSNDLKYNFTSVMSNNNVKRSSKIDDFINSIAAENLIEEVDIKKEITSILTINEDKYESHIFDYESGEELDILDLIKKDREDEFWDKIKNLLYLKYPKFIADVISQNTGENVYFLKDNELIIYYYGYEINPMPKENLYLTVNYNEIKDYLNIPVDLDSTYINEDGSTINPNKKLIAITFDDGPGPYTNELVKILNDNKANATFFMLGSNLEKYQDTVLNVYKSGNEIGYHSYAHKNFLRQDLETIKNEFVMSNEILKNITGTTFSLVRPPYGSIDANVKNALDASFILWNIDTEDWRHKDVDYLFNYVLENVNAGCIILFHDIHKTSVAAIEKILPYLYVEGYQAITVSNLAKNYNTSLESHKAYRYFTE